MKRYFEFFEWFKEKVLSRKEIKQYGTDAGQYAEGLKIMIEEGVSKLDPTAEAEKIRDELADLMEQYEGLEDLARSIENNEIEEATEK